MKCKFFLFTFINLLFVACQNKNKEEAISSVKEWMVKEILLPPNKALHTFLHDKGNKIVAIGNPIENPNAKKFYLKILAEAFPREEAKTGEIHFKNTGDKPFVIYDVVTSCGCTKVDYPKTPIPPGGTLKFTITYEADKLGYFRKSLRVNGNMKKSPMKL